MLSATNLQGNTLIVWTVFEALGDLAGPILLLLLILSIQVAYTPETLDYLS
jgi:hypothetical protein